MKEDWEYKRIKDIGKVIGGTTPNTNVTEYWDGTLCWISPAELDGSHYLYDSRKKITEAAVKAKSLKLLPEGTVILSSRAPIGKVVINKIPTYCNQGFKCVVCGKEIYNEFLYWWFWGKTDYLNSLGTGATFKEISKKVVEEIKIPVPPLSEQQSIVDYLDSAFAKIDALKANAEKALNEAKALFQASLEEMLEPKEGWEEKTLGEVCKELFSGGDAPKGNMSKEPTDDYYIPIYANAAELDGLYGYTNYYRVNEPSVTIAARGSGTGLVVKREGAYLPIVRLIVAIPKSFLSVDYLYFVLQTIRIKSNGTAIPQLTVPVIKQYRICYPSIIAEQQSIVDYLDSLKSKVDRLQENYDKISQECEALKQAILRQVFE